MAKAYPTTRPLMPMSSRIMLQQFSTRQVIASTYQCPCHWRPLTLVPVNPNEFTTPISKHQRGGIEPLHVSMPRELRSCPSTSPSQSGITTNILTKMNVCVSQCPILCKPMPNPPAYRPPPLAIEVSTPPACKPAPCPQFCRLRALAIEPNTFSTRDMR
jgi:hypothetical protein